VAHHEGAGQLAWIRYEHSVSGKLGFAIGRMNMEDHANNSLLASDGTADYHMLVFLSTL
jgi:hypothetical protein